MEIFGILFSIPGAAVASWVYRLFLHRLVATIPWVRMPFLVTSLMVLLGILVEWGLLGFMGILGTRRALGPAFEDLHLINLLFGTPALINVVMLRSAEWSSRWYVVPMATILAFVLVVLQYAVFEGLYAVDGAGGPYGSKIP